MLTYLSTATVLLSAGVLCSCEDTATTGIVSGLATACAQGVRQAVEQEIWAAANHSGEAGTALDVMNSLLRAVHRHDFAPQECPSGWVQHENSCFIIPPQKTNWYRAHHACAVLHPWSKLASVHPRSGPFVEGMVASSGAEKAVWVGLFGSGKAAGNWVWSDGSPFDYAHWDRNQPDGGDPSCIHLGWPGYTNNLWHDNSCAVVINVLCQINLM